jgi:hypothetical protein
VPPASGRVALGVRREAGFVRGEIVQAAPSKCVSRICCNTAAG